MRAEDKSGEHFPPKQLCCPGFARQGGGEGTNVPCAPFQLPPSRSSSSRPSPDCPETKKHTHTHQDTLMSHEEAKRATILIVEQGATGWFLRSQLKTLSTYLAGNTPADAL